MKYSAIRIVLSMRFQLLLMALVCFSWIDSSAALADFPEPQTVTQIPVHYTAPTGGFVSLALYDDKGILVRTLASATPVAAGEHEASWDGTTDLGVPAAPGHFHAKGICFTEPPATKFVMKVGKAGNPPWRTTDGKGDWGANLGGPATICANSNSVMMVWSCVEDGQITGIQQTDADGNIKLRYFSFYPWDGRAAGAMDDTNFYLGIVNREQKRVEIAEYKLGDPRGKILTPLPTRPHSDQSETRWRGRWAATIDGLAITKDAIYASIADDNALFVIDRASGTIRRQLELPTPRGIAVDGDRIYIVSGSRILRLRPDGETESTFVEEGVLDAPKALAIDASRNVYASGAKGQLCVFANSGKIIRRIGSAGGAAAEGRFDAGGIGNVAGICIGPDKKLWIHDTATGFQRVSRWSTEGKLEKQWFNHSLALASEVINPAHFDELIGMSGAFDDAPGITAYAVNPSAGTWAPSWHYDAGWADMFQENVYLSFMHGGNPLNGPRGHDSRWPVFDYGSRHPVTGPNGLSYFLNENGNGDGALFIYDADHKPVPAGMIGYHRCQNNPTTGQIESFYDQGPNNWFTWADRNGDHKMSIDEIIYSQEPKQLVEATRVQETILDAQLNVRMKFWARDAKGKPYMLDKLLPPKEILSSGAVVYDWAMLQNTPTLVPPDLNGGDGTKVVASYNMNVPLVTPVADYCLIEPTSQDPLDLPGIDGKGWWASRNWRTKLARFDKKTGKCVWAVGRRATARANPGEMYHPLHLAGEAEGALFVSDTLGPVWVWNSDGLYIGHLFHDYNSGVADENSLYGEIQATEIYSDPKTHKIYSIANDTGASVHEVILPKIKSFEAGEITLSSAAAAKAKPWNPDGMAPTDRPDYQVAYTRKAPIIDGDMFADNALWWQLSDNRPRPEMPVLLDGKRLASVRAMYDDKNLYLGYDITAPNGTANSGSELPYSPFVSGAYVDFDLGIQWTGRRSDVRNGDLRVIVARVNQGAAQTDFEQGFWQIKSGGRSPQTIQSPAAKVHFDQIGSVAGLQMKYGAGTYDAITGLTHYSVEVAVPLASLGIQQNPAGKTFGFDVSVAVANKAGDRRERAAHWAGLSEGVVVDRPGSAILLPDTWGTLTFMPKDKSSP